MATQKYLTIPTPCHENWNSMTPEQQGRHCAVCAKTVIDFTLMTDGQILEVLKNQKDVTCGRFSNDQLNRPLVKPLAPKWYMVGTWKYILSGFLLFNSGSAKAQVKKDVTITCVDSKPKKLGKVAVVKTSDSDPKRSKPEKEPIELVMGELVSLDNMLNIEKRSLQQQNNTTKNSNQPPTPVDASTINTKPNLLSNTNDTVQISTKFNLPDNHTLGLIAYTRVVTNNQFLVKTEDGHVLPHAGVSIFSNGQYNYLKTDTDGRFYLNNVQENHEYEISVSYVGYNNYIMKLSGKEIKNQLNTINIVLTKKLQQHEDVVILSAEQITCSKKTTICKFATISSDTINANNKEELIDFDKKQPIFSLYPNPVTAGGTINIKVHAEKEDIVGIQLTLLDGKHISIEKRKLVTGLNMFQKTIPNNIAAEALLVRIIGSNGKILFVEKIVVAH